jgi:teichuronic acid biosynthesis protein TuaE
MRNSDAGSIWRAHALNVRAFLAAVALSLLGAVALDSSPRSTALALLVLGALVLALRRPAILFGAAIVLLAFEPTKILRDGSALARPESFKLVLYACTIPLLLDRGIERRKCAPLLAYVLVSVLAECFGTRLPGLSASQTLASLATLSLGWIVFAIRWEWRRDRRLLKVLALVPGLSILAGLALQAAGRVSLFHDTSPPRLEGATIAPWLATLSLSAVLACLLLARREAWRPGRALAALNGLVLAATLTRGALIALAVLLAPSLLAFLRAQMGSRGAGGVIRLAALALCVAAATVALLPGLRARNEDASVLIAGRGNHEIASGRFLAWHFAYQRAKVNLVFGRGVGAGPLVGRTAGGPTGFVAQHNEYLRMLLEVGFVGALVLLLTIACTLAAVIARAPPVVRPQLTAAALAFGVYSITENTLSATPLAVAFLLVFSLGACAVRPVESEIPPRAHV